MLQAARANFKDGPRSTTQFSFVQGNAKNLNMLEDESVDLIISGMTTSFIFPLYLGSHLFAETALYVP